MTHSAPSEEHSPDTSSRFVKFPANYASLDEVREFVGQAAEDCGLGPKAVYAVQMAADEAFTNVIEHSYGGESQEIIELTCQIDRDRMVIQLRDCGRPFNPDEIEAPDTTGELEDRETGGLGLFFMRQLMDEVRFEFFPATGEQEACNIVTMVKLKERPGKA